MKVERIGMSKLLGHPGNVNVMRGEVMAKLKGHIAKGGGMSLWWCGGIRRGRVVIRF